MSALRLGQGRGVRAHPRALATEGPAHGIRVNALAPRAYTRMSALQAEALAELFAMPKDASMPPELCAPQRPSSPTSPVRTSPLTAEDIAENLDQIMDVADAQVTESSRSVS